MANAVAVQDDGKIVVVGNAFGPMFSEDFAIARYNPNGSLDTSFSGDGKQTASFLTTAEANGVAIQGDGKIVVVGTGVDNIDGGSEGAIARYNPNGTLDTSFSGDGTQTTDFGLGEGAQATGLAIQGDGKIVIVGSAGATTSARTSPSPATTPMARSTRASPATARRRPTLAAPTWRAEWRSRVTARSLRWARPNPAPAATTSPSPATTPTARSTRASPATASRRPTSGSGPTTRRTASRSRATARSSRSGRASGGATGDDFALARYNPDGSLDTTFSGDGKRRTSFGGDDEANGVALQADGRIVAVGRGLGFDETSDFALARFLGG